MALHQAIQDLLLIGSRLKFPQPAPEASPPERLVPLIEALAPSHRMFDERAMHYGHRYRSGFWAIYLLSAIAVLFAVLPLALGWDDRRHVLNPFLGLWAVAEVGVIGTVSGIYWLGHRHDWQGEWLRARTIQQQTGMCRCSIRASTYVAAMIFRRSARNSSPSRERNSTAPGRILSSYPVTHCGP
jgi:hypothetical protein